MPLHMSSLRTTLGVLTMFVIAAAASGCATSMEEEEIGESADELRGGKGGRGGFGGGFGGFGGGGRKEDPGGGHGHHKRPRPEWRGHGRGPQRIDQPQGAYFANITANGTGCPDGSWDVAISEDGETFTLRFNAYEARVSAGTAFDIKDCKIEISLASPEGTSFSVASFTYQGFVFLEKEGMSAQQTSNYFFRRERENEANNNDLPGPKEESYMVTDEVGPRRAAWSPCGRDETLKISTRLLLKNDENQSGEGYINSAVLDGALFKWNLKWRRCRMEF
jgi:hypothetical protein